MLWEDSVVPNSLRARARYADNIMISGRFRRILRDGVIIIIISRKDDIGAGSCTRDWWYGLVAFDACLSEWAPAVSKRLLRDASGPIFSRSS